MICLGEVFHVLLRKMYIQLLGGVYMSGSFGCFIVLFVFSISLLIFCMVVLLLKVGYQSLQILLEKHLFHFLFS